MYEYEYEMSLSNEDLVMIIIGIIVFILSFVDFQFAFIAFPAVVTFLIGWGIARFRQRPLPKQVHETRTRYLAIVRTFRNFHLLNIIFLNILWMFGFPNPETNPIGEQNIATAIIFSYLALVLLSFAEFFSHVVIPDLLTFLPKMEDEDEQLWKKKRYSILYGSKFIIFLVASGIVSLGISYLAISSIILSRTVLVIVFMCVFLLAGAGLVAFFYKKTLAREQEFKADAIIKAVDYYNQSNLREMSYELLSRYIKANPDNFAILSKLAVMHARDNNFDQVLSTTEKILAETEEKALKVPHTIAKAHLLRAVSFKALEKYKQAYKEVSASLTHTPDNQVARKIRRELRKILKSQERKKIEVE